MNVSHQAMEQTLIHTSLGPAVLQGNRTGLQSLQFLDDSPPPPAGNVSSHLEKAANQISDYFRGTLKVFDLELDLQGTSFQQAVWKELLEIPWGQQITYLQLATKLGIPASVRAVAAAIGKNPLLVIIPCHRVVGSNGSLTGYAGGLQRKQWLLEHEYQGGQQRLF